MISFVYYFHSSRIKNLEQTLRFLKKRENLDQNEVILVCNDFVDKKFDLPNYKLFNLKLKDYNKPKLCNYGVEQASGEIICLLDSDRILPEKYFETTAYSLKNGFFATCSNIRNLNKDYEDQQIEEEKYDFSEEVKSKKCELHKKNLFSGNTVFYKKDYSLCGGMDENFIGYGYADNDMTMNILSKGFKILWKKDFELHLDHTKEFMYDKEMKKGYEFIRILEKNLNLFLSKWDGKSTNSLLSKLI